MAEPKKSYLVTKLGSLLHDEWRMPRKQDDGTFAPNFKKTKDQAWSQIHGTAKVDIANTDYANLPKDWQNENKLSAEVAMNEVDHALVTGRALDEAFIESASDVIHKKWLERNGGGALAEKNIPDVELPEKEKEKDRVIIKKAIELYNSAR